MKFLVFIAICLSLSYGVKLNDITITPNKESLEILLLLDSKFENKIIQQDNSSFSTIILKDLNYNKNKVSTHTELINDIEIFSQNNDVYIVLGEENFALKYTLEALNADNAIKLIIKPQISIVSSILSNNESAKSLEEQISIIKNSSINTMPNDISSKVETWRYMLVVMILFGLIIALIIIKKRMFKRSGNISFPYFREQKLMVSQTINLDMKNKIIILDSKDSSYILFVGQNGSFIIDKMPKFSNNEDFGTFLAKNENKLSYFLNAYERNSIKK
ncbi:MAG: hypothetical protein K2P17_05080 [Helicobacteraceae bacterium]|nr:hypothetical protein [Helicobacteraceae bacterium]